LRGHDVVAGQPEPAAQQPVAAAQAVAGVADGGAFATGRRVAERRPVRRRAGKVHIGQPVDVTPAGAGLHNGGGPAGVEGDGAHLADVDHDATGGETEPGGVVTAAAHRDRQTGVAGEADRAGHVVGAGAAAQYRRPGSHVAVEQHAGVFVTGVRRGEDRATERLAETLDIGAHQDPPPAPASYFFSTSNRVAPRSRSRANRPKSAAWSTSGPTSSVVPSSARVTVRPSYQVDHPGST